MPHAGQEIQGFDGFKLVLVKTEPDLLEMEATYGGTGQLPPEHLHPKQDEHFEVLEGSVRAVVAGEESTYGPGGEFDVPAGTPHQMAADEPSRVRWQVRPALRTAEFFERLFGDGPDAARNTPNIADFFAEFSDEIQLTR